jgi:hypothetical protein
MATTPDPISPPPDNPRRPEDKIIKDYVKSNVLREHSIYYPSVMQLVDRHTGKLFHDHFRVLVVVQQPTRHEGGHPEVAAVVSRPWDNPLFYEEVNYAASYAFERVTGDDDAFHDALDLRAPRGRAPVDMGEDFDFDDEQEMRRRLPRLADICLGDSAT